MSARISYTSHSLSQKKKKNKEPTIQPTPPPKQFQSDLQAFLAFKRVSTGLISGDLISELWNSAKEIAADGSCSEKYDLAMVFLNERLAMMDFPTLTSSAQKIELNSTSQSSNSSKSVPSSSNSTTLEERSNDIPVNGPFGEFASIYIDMIPIEKLQDIWHGLDNSMGSDEKQELASMYAMDYLASVCEVRSIKRRPIRAKKQDRDKSFKKEGMTHQETALYLIDMIFRGEKLDRMTKQLALVEREYDVERTTSYLCDLLLRKGCFVRPDTSYVDVVVSGSTPKDSKVAPWYLSNRDTAAVSLLSNTAVPRPSTAEELPEPSIKGVTISGNGTVTTVGSETITEGDTDFIISPAVRSTDEFKLAEHFLRIFRQQNPHIICGLNRYCELIYQGTHKHYRRIHESDLYVLSVTVDLHYLHVLPSLQIVDSALDHYLSNLDHLRFAEKKRQVLLNFVVGKGLHSVGGVARVGPAVVQRLQERGEESFILYEGQVTVHIRL